MSSAIISAIIAGIFSIICALIARSGPRAPSGITASSHVNVTALPWSASRWLSWVACVAWIIPLFGFPFSLTALGFALRDGKADEKRVPPYAIPLALITLALTVLNAIWGGYQAAHGCQFWQPQGGCHQ